MFAVQLQEVRANVIQPGGLGVGLDLGFVSRRCPDSYPFGFYFFSSGCGFWVLHFSSFL
jgi:hypothetical protein